MSALGLNWQQRYNTRQRMKRAALLCHKHRSALHYTQGNLRWQYINRRLHASEGQYPNYADCSSLTTGFAWDVTRRYNLKDFVNGCNWNYGYTGTQVQHGVSIPINRRRLLVGDFIFYGYGPSHVAIYVGKGLVVSHGSESGPLLLRWDYRAVHSVRRYIR